MEMVGDGNGDDEERPVEEDQYGSDVDGEWNELGTDWMLEEFEKFSSANVNWQTLGEVSYRKWILYNPKWNVTGLELEEYECVVSTFGGLIAIFDKHPGGDLVGKPMATKNAGAIYTMHGKHVANLPHQGLELAEGGIGWMTMPECLVCCYVTGLLHVLDTRGQSLGEYSLLDDMVDESVDRVQVYKDGLMLLLVSGKLVQVSGFIHLNNLGDATSFHKPKRSGSDVSKRVLNGGQSIYDGLEFVPKSCGMVVSESGQVFVATMGGKVLGVDALGCEQYDASKSGAQVLRMAVAPNGRFMACFTSDGWLTVSSTNFAKRVLEFDTKAGLEPVSLAWCGEDSVVMYWKQLGLLMVGPYGDWVKYTYHEPLVIVQEIDSLRIVSSKKVELLQRVHASTDSICRIGSFEPPAMLVDALEAMESKDPKADENIRALCEEGTMVKAVRDCIEAACMEFDIRRQQLLLKAAAMGKLFCETQEDQKALADEFVLACKKLRTLNVLRHDSIAMPLTLKQYEVLGNSQLITRLLSRHHHFLAQKLCLYLGLPIYVNRQVLEHWACVKVTTPFPASKVDENVMFDDEQEQIRLFNTLQSKLCKVPANVSYSKIAVHAFKVKRRRLAVLLVDADAMTHRRILTLMHMGEYQLALAHAVYSNDPDLMFYVVFKVWNIAAVPSSPSSNTLNPNANGNAATTQSLGGRINLTKMQFFALLKRYPEVCGTFIDYCRKIHDHKTLKETFFQSGDLHAAADLVVADAYRCRNLLKRTEKMGFALEMYRNSKNLAFQSEMTEYQLRLTDTQRDLEKQTGENCFLDNSLVDTIYNCIVLGLHSQAEDLRATFKLNDRSFWSVKLKALAQIEEWDQLRAFALSKPSPVGYKPFAEACFAKSNLHEADFYAQRIESALDRLDVYIMLKSWDKALALAAELRDVASLSVIQAKCDDPEITKQIAALHM